MTPEKLANLIDLYGSALDLWPNAKQRAAAADLLDRSEAARSQLRRAEELERCLRPPPAHLIERAFDAAPDDPANERLIARIMAVARQTPQAPPPLSHRAQLWLRGLPGLIGERWWGCYALPALAALALGIVVGHATLDQSGYIQSQPGVERLITSTHSMEPFKL